MSSVCPSIPRPEHPNPQFRRENWFNLNGSWAFALDHGRSGQSRGMHLANADYPLSITVPFCPESELSGIGYKDFIRGAWYRRTVNLTEEQVSGRVLLHFGAVDYECTVYVNEKQAGTHKGGFVSFSLDITELVQAGENTIVVNAIDDSSDRRIPSGKQSGRYESFGCFYTRTTGIWQTVWMEFVPRSYIQSIKLTPSVADTAVTVEATLEGAGELTVTVSYNGTPMGSSTVTGHKGIVYVTVPLAEKHLWQPGEGRLYDLELTYGDDTVYSYFGLREMHFDGMKWMLNGRSVFQRLILDQGFYPDGLYTAPSEEAMVADIMRGLSMGFNGARLHQKVFEPRFLYHCDRLGYLVWGEYPSWGLDDSKPENLFNMLPEWMEIVKRDYNHPSIVVWCPFNECSGEQCNDLIRMVYLTTKQLDPTRSCIDTSGWYHVETDIYDVHDYDQNPAVFKEHYDDLWKNNRVYEFLDDCPYFLTGRQSWGGQPVMVSEFGGTGWSMSGTSWGYGDVPKAREEFINRFKGLVDALLDNPQMCGFCYTQLTDIEQEQNGLYTYDRVAKFEPEIIAPIVSRKAAIED